MPHSTPIAPLMLMTLIAALAIGALVLIWHRRKASNRHPMDGQRERNIKEMKRGEPPER